MIASVSSNLLRMAESKGVALVTGAAQGIGRAISLRLADDGFDVFVNDIRGDELPGIVEEIEKRGRRGCWDVADVSIEEEVKQMVEKAVNRLGSLDVMIANAGVASYGPLIETTEEEWDKMFAVNAKGTFFCYKHAGIHMIAQGHGGRIIGACSVSGKRGNANMVAYCGAKFAVRGITQTAAVEFAEHGITVNAYAPGPIETPLLQALDTAYAQRNQKRDGEFKEMLRNRLPVGYNGSTAEIASLVSYLASKEAHFITGQTISCNGGMYFD